MREKMAQVTEDGIPVFCSYSRLANIEGVIPNPRNPNTHPEKQLKLLAKIIRTQGWRVPITVSKRSGFVVRGHGRLLAAQLAGLNEVPIDEQDYATEADEYADLVADNRLAELAKVDKGILGDLLSEFNDGEFDMDLFGYDEKELNKLLEQEEAAVEPEPEIGLVPRLLEEHNLLVLYFDNEIDWESAVQTFGLEVQTDEIGLAAKKVNGKTPRRGLGRIIRGDRVLQMVHGEGARGE